MATNSRTLTVTLAVALTLTLNLTLTLTLTRCISFGPGLTNPNPSPSPNPNQAHLARPRPHKPSGRARLLRQRGGAAAAYCRVQPEQAARPASRGPSRIARQCAKNSLMTYQLKGTFFCSTHAPCCPVTGMVWSRDLVPRGARARTSHRPSRPRSIAKPSTSRPQIVVTLHFLYRRSCTAHMCGRQGLKTGMSPV